MRIFRGDATHRASRASARLSRYFPGHSRYAATRSQEAVKQKTPAGRRAIISSKEVGKRSRDAGQ
jgi:hypothetical protein